MRTMKILRSTEPSDAVLKKMDEVELEVREHSQRVRRAKRAKKSATRRASAAHRTPQPSSRAAV